MLRLKNIGKIYTKEGNVNKALSDVNLSFDNNEFVAITGKSGSGKSTLLSILSGLESYEEGELYFNGRPTSHYTKEDWEEYNRENISFIFQDYNILESFTVLENVEYALTRIKSLKERRKKAKEIIDRVGLTDRIYSRGSTLSGGEKQRTVIARAIAKDSPIILADEPTGNLDSKTAKEVLALLKEVSKDKLVIVVTHNYEDVEEYATRHIRLYDSKVELDERFDGLKNDEEVKERDKYDFGDAHEYIFKRAEKKKQDKGYFADIFSLGVKRFSSRPKQAILLSTMTSIVLIVLFIMLSVIISALSPGSIISNDIEGRVIFGGFKDKPTTYAEVDKLAKDVGAITGVANDEYFGNSYELVNDLHRYNEGLRDNIFYNLDIYDKERYSDIEEVKDFEIALDLAYPTSFNSKIGDTIYIALGDSCECFLQVKIVDIKRHFKVDNSKDKIIVSPNFYRRYFKQFNFIQLLIYSQNKMINDATGEVVRIDYAPLHFNYIVLTNELSGYDVKLTSVYENFADRIYRFNDEKYEPIKATGFVKGGLPGLWIGTDWLDEYINVDDKGNIIENVGSISLIFKNDDEAVKFIENADTKLYSVISSRELASLDSKFDVYSLLELVSSIIFAGLISAAVCSILMLSIKKALLATKADIAIFRTMGISAKTVRKSTYIQLTMATISAYIGVVVAALISYFTTIGNTIHVLGLGGALLLALAGVIVIWLTSRYFNQLLYDERIKKSLRRVNK